MRLRLQPSSGVPIYRQIVDQLSYRIASGRLREGDRLPSVRELAQALPANQNTVIKAYELLERDGLIQRKHGDGTYVTGQGADVPAAERRRLVGELLAAAAARARLFDVPPERLHQWLDEELKRLGSEDDAS